MPQRSLPSLLGPERPAVCCRAALADSQLCWLLGQPPAGGLVASRPAGMTSVVAKTIVSHVPVLSKTENCSHGQTMPKEDRTTADIGCTRNGSPNGMEFGVFRYVEKVKRIRYLSDQTRNKFLLTF